MTFIAFANTRGGTILIGVDDEGNVNNDKYSDESFTNLNTNIRHSDQGVSFFYLMYFQRWFAHTNTRKSK